MTNLSQVLDTVWTATERLDASAELALNLPRPVLFDVLLLAARAYASPWLEILNCDVESADIRAGAHLATMRLDDPSQGIALVIADDRGLGLVSDDATLGCLWGAPLHLKASQMLLAAQFARDEADILLYRADVKDAVFEAKAGQFGLLPALLRGLALLDWSGERGAHRLTA